jgi:membrane protein required for colicin V production
MIVDLAFVAAIAFAFFIGYRKGFIHSFLSVLAFFLGIVLALQCSHLAGKYLHQWFNLGSSYIPVVSFLVVLVAVMFVMWLLSKMLETMINMTGLGIINKLSGALLWMIVAVFTFSTLLFYASQSGMISSQQQASSRTFNHLQPIAPIAIEQIGKAVPFLEGTFDRVASHMKSETDDPAD